MNIIAVTSAEHIGDYKVHVHFSDGASQVIDFLPFLQSFRHPDYEQYFDLEYFKRFKIIEGNINWDDYNLIFPVDDLYEGRLLR